MIELMAIPQRNKTKEWQQKAEMFNALFDVDIKMVESGDYVKLSISSPHDKTKGFQIEVIGQVTDERKLEMVNALLRRVKTKIFE